MSAGENMSIAEKLAPHLPFLRRYARALSGSQMAGDELVRATLAGLVTDSRPLLALLEGGVAPRIALYCCFQQYAEGLDATAGPATVKPGMSHADIASLRLAGVGLASRQALLLGAMEGFSPDEIALIMDCRESRVDALVADAMADIAAQTRTDILIIEDEPIIAMHLEAIVTDLGHQVSAIVTTYDEAVSAFAKKAPGLVLADVQLADGSSGIDAVKHILADRITPAIFITAFPERLLTGARPEPTLLIPKPFKQETVEATLAQALFFNSTAPFGL